MTKRPLLLVSGGLVLAGTMMPSVAMAGPSDTLHINEILHNPEGTDAPNEYVEIKGTPGATIPAGTYLVFIEGDTGTANPGDINNLFDLSGLTLGSNGFLLITQKSNTYTINPAATVITGTGASGFAGAAGWASDSGTDIENETFTAMLISAASAPALATDIDADNDGTTDGAVFPTWTVLDSVASLEHSSAGTDRAYSPVVFAWPDSLPSTNGAEWVGRPTGDPSGITMADWVGADFLGTQPDIVWELEAAIPATYTGYQLNHLGGPNWPSEEVPEAPIALLLAAAGAAGTLMWFRRSVAL